MSLTEKPITEAELSDIMAVDALCDKQARITLSNPTPDMVQNVKGLFSLANEVPRLVAEVRRLNGIIPGLLDAARVEQMEVDVQYKRQECGKLEAELLAVTVERDNLRKMLEDANQREQELIGKFVGILPTIVKAREVIDDELEERPARHSLGKLHAEMRQLEAALTPPKPVPMCKAETIFDGKGGIRITINPKPDPLGDLPWDGEGSGGGC